MAFSIILVNINFYYSVFNIVKVFIPKIKDNLDNREKNKRELRRSERLFRTCWKERLDYENEIMKAKKEVIKIIADSKKQIEKNINKKKEEFNKELENKLKKLKVKYWI